MVSSAVRKAFAVFDLDNSGTLTAEECLAILTRGASDEEKEDMGMSIEDAQEIIDDFDRNGDGVLSIEEFADAFDMFMLDEDDAEFQGGDTGADADPPPKAAPPAAPPAAPKSTPKATPKASGSGESAPAAPFVYKGYPASGPGFAMFSPQSLGCLSTKVMNKTFEKNLDRRGRSLKFCEGYGVSASKPFAMRYGTQAGTMSEWADDVDGASIQVPENTELGLDIVMASHLPLSAPIAKLEKAKPKGPVVVSAVTCICDLYVSVDGVDQQDGWILCGEVGASNADAIKKSYDLAPTDAEAAVKKALEDGPPGDIRPWATLVGKTDFGTDCFIHLPLIAVDLASACVEESESYGPQLLARFAALLAEVGAGTHQWSIRLQPRGVVSADPLRVNAVGQFDKGIGLNEDHYMEKDAAFQSLIRGLAQQAHVAHPHPGLKASFSMTVPEKYCTGDGPERFAEEFNPNFSKDAAEYCEYAKKIASTGASGSAARSVISRLGAPNHIIIAGYELAGGWTPLGGDGIEKAGERFVPWALWKNPDDDDDDAMGVMVKFWAIRYDRKNHAPVADPSVWH